jgi:uncharacterized oxidoreductase
MIQVSPEELTSFAENLLRAGGVAVSEAPLVALSLVGANLRGHDSHGVMRIPYYLDCLTKGEVVCGVELLVQRDTDSLLVTDAQWGFGQVQARRLAQRLISKANESGIALGTMIRSGHVGRLGEYCEMAVERECVAIMMVNTHGHARRVAPPGGLAPRLGTNPLAVGIPDRDRPIIIDFGTSATAEGKVRVKKIAGQRCPEGWLLDNQGQPTTDPNALYATPPGTIRPMGGDQPFKGFALGLMVEVLAGALSGGVCIRETPINQNGNCVFMLVLDPSQVAGRDHFVHEVTQLVDFIRGCPRVENVAEITLPGDPERRTMAQRLQDGIPFDDGNWRELADLAGKLNVPVPS